MPTAKKTPSATGLSFSVSSPGFDVDSRPVAVAPGAKALKAVSSGEAQALEENEFRSVDKPVQMTASAPKGKQARIKQFGSDEPHAEIRATAAPDEVLVLRVEKDGLVQWYLPERLSRQARAAQTKAKGNGVESRFLVPHSMLARPKGAKSIGGAIVHFFATKLVRELAGAAVTYVLEWLAKKVEARSKEERLVFFGDQDSSQPARWDDLEAFRGTPMLLLVHGIFSSVDGAFGKLRGSGAMQRLRSVYQNRIVGFDHWTVAKTPLENAAQLLSLLPPGLDLDIMCHSRGGLVTRAMLEYPDPDLDRLRSQQSFRRALFAAGANQGSALARRANWNRLLNVFIGISSLVPDGIVLSVVFGLLKVLAHGASRLPSIEALRPDLPDESNPFLRSLNERLVSPRIQEYAVVHANFDAAGRAAALRALDLGVDFVFEMAANDLVVPYAGAAAFDPGQFSIPVREVTFGSQTVGQGAVYHTIYFSQPAVHSLIQDFLV
jgi:hypothetical protein